jgi:hypothetical protein
VDGMIIMNMIQEVYHLTDTKKNNQ